MMKLQGWASFSVYLVWFLLSWNAQAENTIGVRGEVGCRENPKRVTRLQITRPGVYENYLVDSEWAGGNRVKITADDVTLRHCEIRNATGNGIGVFGKNVTIENCKVHHLLNSTFDQQHDAHGITGRWSKATIRNCEVYYVSGDCVQFDPDRQSTGKVLIENCTFWTGPLPADAAGFKKGERPGENAFDSKTPARGPRCELTMRNCLMYGWNQPGQISLMAAVNLKENVRATVDNCLFRDNQVCFRLRGPTGRGDALVTINNCAIFESGVGVRMEDKIRDLKIRNLAFGEGVERKYHMVGRGPFAGHDNRGESKAESFESILKSGRATADAPERSTNKEPEEAEAKVESGAPKGNLPAAADQHWPRVRAGHYVKWVDRVWNTRKPAKIWQDGDIGILGQHNGTGTYLGEDKAGGGTVEFDVKFDAGYLAPEGGGKHFLEIMSWIADRSDREAVRAQPWSRIELARFGDRPRCVVWNYGPHFNGETTELFSIGPPLKPDRWYHIRFDWSYRAPSGRVTIHIDDRSYSSTFKLVPNTEGPGRFFLFGHVETKQPEGRLHFRNFRINN